jgi:hypothetical protein
MSATSSNKGRRILVGGLVAAAIAAPLTLASAPAQAATLNGCTVNPLTPSVVTVAGVKRVQYRVQVSCAANRIVQIRDWRYESDSPAGLAGDDFLGSVTHLRTFASAGSVTLISLGGLPNTESSNEEVYHRTSFRVATISGVTGFTSFQNSGIRSVDN